MIPPRAATPELDRPGRRRARAAWFAVGDAAFLALAGVVSTLTMHRCHEFGWGFLPSCAAGMVAAMAAQMLLAFCAAPLLGSIESMTPSMVVGMISPMSVCTLHLLGHAPHAATAAACGAVWGLGMFLFVQRYARTCRRTLRTLARGQ